MRILLLLDKEYNSLQCLILHKVFRPDFETITEGIELYLPQNLSSYYKALDRDFSNLIITLHLLGFDDAVLGLYSAYISPLSSYSIFPSSVLETHKD